ncbi:hypothetical protein JNO12_06710 [Erwinia aphidicola]|nr:hypothetical protein [Erwinia aphidicola]
MPRIFFLAIGMFALGLDAYVVAGILPEIGKTFGTSDAINAQTVTAFTLCYAIAAPVFATLLVRKSVKKSAYRCAAGIYYRQYCQRPQS